MIMKTNMKLKLAATAAAVLATGLLSQNAKAGAVVGQQYDATLENMSETRLHRRYIRGSLLGDRSRPGCLLLLL